MFLCFSWEGRCNPGPGLEAQALSATRMIEIAVSPPKTMPASPSDRKELAEIRKESLDIYNRIHSIAEDSIFVAKAVEHYNGYPVIRAARPSSSVGTELNRNPQQT